MSIDRRAAEQALTEFMRALGHDPSLRAELVATPARVVDAYLSDFLVGYDVDIQTLLEQGIEPAITQRDSTVIVENIRTTTLCPHHLMPAAGKALVAYRPSQLLLGISTLSKLVDALARRLTLQEQITDGITDALMQHVQAEGAYCELRLSHSCLTERGPRQHDATVVTQSVRGYFKKPSGLAELDLLLKRGTGPAEAGAGKP